jgi:hypothetical protein
MIKPYAIPTNITPESYLSGRKGDFFPPFSIEKQYIRSSKVEVKNAIRDKGYLSPLSFFAST